MKMIGESFHLFVSIKLVTSSWRARSGVYLIIQPMIYLAYARHRLKTKKFIILYLEHVIIFEHSLRFLFYPFFSPFLSLSLSILSPPYQSG